MAKQDGNIFSTYKSVSTAAEFLLLAADYYSPHLWIAANIVVTLPASFYIRAPFRKMIDGPGIITFIGNVDSTQCNVYGSTDPTSNNVNYMTKASVDFKNNVAVQYYFTCHKSTFRFRRANSIAFSSSTIYGIVADSAAIVRYAFPDFGYVSVRAAGDSEIVIYDGHQGRLFYNPTVMLQTLSGSSTIYPTPNFTYKITSTLTATFVAPPFENSLIAFNMEFFIRLEIGCGTTVTIIALDPDGNSVTYIISQTVQSTIHKTIKVKQLGAGYILDSM